MRCPIIVVDDFFESPHLVRDFALNHFIADKENYFPRDNASGLRTKTLDIINSELNDLVYKKLSKIVSDITDVHIDKVKINITFQYSPSYWEIGTSFHIHKDTENDYKDFFSFIVFLHPNPPDGKGTAFYKLDPEKINSHQEFMKTKFSEMMRYKILLTNHFQELCEEDKQTAKNLILEHDSHFIMTDYVGNKFNRLLVFPSDEFHDGFGYFGNDIYDSRLIMIGFARIKDFRDIPLITKTMANRSYNGLP